MTPPGNHVLVQLGTSIPYRLIGFALVVVVGVGLLWVAVRETDGSTPVYEEDEDDETELYVPDPAYGATGTTDVTEVLELEDEETPTADGRSPAPASDGDGSPPDGADVGHGTPDGGGFDHEYRGKRSRGHLVAVTDGEGRSAEFFVRNLDGSDPAVEPASARDRRHDEEWLRDAETYVREQARSGDLRW